MCANLINLQKNDKQTVFEVYLTLAMPLNHVFRFLFKYGGWYVAKPALTIMYAHPLNMKISEQIWVNTVVALHS